MCSPSASGNRRSRTAPFERTSTASLASFGPIAAAASRPVAPSGSSSSELSGRTTFMPVTLIQPEHFDVDDVAVDRVDDVLADRHLLPAPEPPLHRQGRVETPAAFDRALAPLPDLESGDLVCEVRPPCLAQQRLQIRELRGDERHPCCCNG